MAHEVHDHYFHQAKRDGYRSRAAYKLIEIDDKRKLLRKGQHVLDCGAAPGSWLQVAGRRIGPNGVVVGVDLKPIEPNFRETNIRLIQGDFRELDAREMLLAAGFDESDLASDARFDVVLSDMAPYTTGEHFRDHHRSIRLCQTLLEQTPKLLAPGGPLVMKVFEGEAYADLLAQTRAMFKRVKGFKPKASRGTSTEMFVIAEGFHPDAASGEAHDDADDPDRRPPQRKPSTGWE